MNYPPQNFSLNSTPPAAMRALLMLACLLPVVGCDRAAAPTVSPEIGTNSIVDASQSLCLARSEGLHGPVAASLTKAQAALREHPEPAANWVAVGQQWVRQARISADPGFYLNVDGCVDQALARVSDDATALALRGLVLMNTHQFEAARLLSEQMLQRDPENVLALGTLSDALLELGRYPESIAAAQRQMATLPGMAAHARGAYLSWLHGDRTRAKLLIRDALQGRTRDDPEPAAWAFVEAARLFWQEGDLDGADALLVEALNWVADYPAALVLRARIALAQAEPRRAIDYLQVAQRIQPAVESAWLLSDAHTLLQDDKAARAWFDKARRLGAQGDRLTLAMMLAVHNVDPDLALALLQSERQVRGGVQIDDAYAWALYRSGRVDEAALASTQALRLKTPDPRLLYHAGAIRIEQGQQATGRALIAQALALNPGFDPIEAPIAHALLEQPIALAARR